MLHGQDTPSLILVNKKVHTTMLLSIVIPVFNPTHLESKIEKFLVPQLESFERNTNLAGVELIYVANGCTEKTRQVLESFKGRLPVKIMWFDEGLGFTVATNIGIKASRGAVVLLFNDDAIILDYMPKDGWKRWLLGPFHDDKRVGITGCHELMCPYSRELFIVGYCLACRREMLQQIGLLDEIFSPGACEDVDICIRARLAGWRVVDVSPQASAQQCTFPIYHPGESTFHNWESVGDFTPTSKWSVVFERNGQILAGRRTSGFYLGNKNGESRVPTL